MRKHKVPLFNININVLIMHYKYLLMAKTYGNQNGINVSVNSECSRMLNYNIMEKKHEK
jgi:hypothetical protein